MLLFLNARGRTPPDAFVMYDYEAGRIGHVTKAIVPLFLNQHTMMLTGRADPESYCELQSWDQHQGAFDALFDGRGIDPGAGLEILKTQERVLRFLVAFCETVLQDIKADLLVNDDLLVQPEPRLPAEDATGFRNRAVMAAEAPYRPPASLDMSRASLLLSTRLSAAQDHIWALREDPGYFAEYIGEYKEHRQELIKDTNGESHPLFKLGREGIFWARVIGNVVGEVYLSHEVWTELHNQSVVLRGLLEKYAASLSFEKGLPTELLDAFLKFQHYLQ